MKFIIALVAVLVFSELISATAAQDCSELELEAPIYTGVWPYLTRARLMVGRGVANTCGITEAIVSCTNDGTDQFERTVSYDSWMDLTIYNLEPDTVYTCYVRWQNSPNSKPFRFRTRDLVPKQLVISDVTENAFRVSWTEDYDIDFVLGYQLQIASSGPLHFLRDDCDHSRPWLTLHFDNTVFSSVFNGGLPNYVFSAQLITNYNLSSDIYGLNEVSLLEVVFLNEAAPAAPEDMTVDFRCEGGTGYNVTAVVSWIPPCELNGTLVGFIITVQAIFVQGGNVGVEYTKSIEAISPNYRYLYKLPELSPLFRYVVNVSTVAAFTGPSSAIHITPPDANYCT